MFVITGLCLSLRQDDEQPYRWVNSFKTFGEGVSENTEEGIFQRECMEANLSSFTPQLTRF